jgi:hypothetical protein
MDIAMDGWMDGIMGYCVGIRRTIAPSHLRLAPFPSRILSRPCLASFQTYTANHRVCPPPNDALTIATVAFLGNDLGCGFNTRLELY